jgi:uncharacterized membrane protein YfcA
MSATLAGLLAAVTAVNAVFGWKWIAAARQQPRPVRPGPIDLLIGFVTDFLDALGIGSFATTIALFKFRRTPSDDLIPGTLNAGHTPAAFVETLIFVTIVSVDPVLLVSMVASATAGAWLGAGIVTRLPLRAIQFFMGGALLLGAVLYAAANLGLFPAGGTAMSLAGAPFAIAAAANFVFGTLMTVGIGLYAPCMITLALLGLHPLAAFPIMMSSCALVQPVAGMRFLGRNRIAWSAAMGLAVGGVVGVLVAAFVVKQLSLEALRWLAAGVVAYAALTMLRSAIRGPAATAQAAWR